MTWTHVGFSQYAVSPRTGIYYTVRENGSTWEAAALVPLVDKSRCDYVRSEHAAKEWAERYDKTREAKGA